MAGRTLMGKRPTKGRSPKGVVKTFRCTAEWGEWFGRFVEHYNASQPIEYREGDIIAVAVAAMARELGFPESPPKR